MRSTPSRVGAIAAVLVACGAVVWFEAHHKIPGFRAWTFGCVFLAAAICTGLARGVIRNACLVLATMFLGLAALEATALALQPKGGDLQITPFWLILKPEVGFGFAQAGVAHARKRDPDTGAVIYEVNYTIDGDFNRQVLSAAGGPATVFFGDSFTFGDGVNDAGTMPQQFADVFDRKRRVLNLAITGYSPQQFLREVETGMQDALIGPHPDAFVFLTSPFHAKRTACKESWIARAPRYTLENGRPVYQGVCYAGARLAAFEFLENTAFYRLAIRPYALGLTRADVDLYIAVLAEAARISRERYGVATLVPFIRAPAGYLAGTGYDDESVVAALRARGVRVVDMTLSDDPAKGFVASIAGDGHPTAAAHAVRARMIADALKTAAGPATGVPQ